MFKELLEEIAELADALEAEVEKLAGEMESNRAHVAQLTAQNAALSRNQREMSRQLEALKKFKESFFPSVDAGEGASE